MTLQSDNNAPDINEIETDMSDSELESYVNDQLGLPTTPPAADSSTNSDDTTSTDGGGDEQGDNKQDGDVQGGQSGDPDTSTTTTSTPSSQDKPADVKQDDTEPELDTSDLWVEVDQVIKDSEGNVTGTERVKLTYDPDNPDGFIPEGFVFKDEKQLFALLDARNEMRRLYDERKSEYDQKTQERTTQQNELKERESQLASWDAEIDDLIADGLLKAPQAKAGDKDFEKDESIQRIDKVFRFMTEQNQERVKEGKQPITSFAAAFHKLAAQDAKAEAEAEAQRKNQETKQKGAMIGGSSAASGSSSNSPTYVAGSAGSIYDVPLDI